MPIATSGWLGAGGFLRHDGASSPQTTLFFLSPCLSTVRLGCTLLGQHAVRCCMIFWVKQQGCGKWFSFQDGMIPPSLTSW